MILILLALVMLAPMMGALYVTIRMIRRRSWGRGFAAGSGDEGWYQREISRYRLTLQGISSCSTCEVCRGAAEIALGLRKWTCKHLMRDPSDCVFCERDSLKRRVEELTLGLQGIGKHPAECTEEGGACVSHLAFEELIMERDSAYDLLCCARPAEHLESSTPEEWYEQRAAWFKRNREET